MPRRHAFDAIGMLPYRYLFSIPWLRQPVYARVLSMPEDSTSELLRTL